MDSGPIDGRADRAADSNASAADSNASAADSNASAADSNGPSRLGRLLGGLALRAEDLILAGWIGLAAPALASFGGSAGPFDSGQPVVGTVQLVGFFGALACLATRSSDAPAAGRSRAAGPNWEMPRAASSPDATPAYSALNTAVIGPLVGGLMLVGGSGAIQIGLDPEPLFGLTFAGAIVLALLGPHLPAIPTIWRRALVTPYLLAAGGIFWSVVHTVAGGLDVRSVVGSSAVDLSGAALGVAGLLILAAGIYYAMLIFAARQIAEREGGPLAWLVRFALFVASVAFGLGWLNLVG